MYGKDEMEALDSDRSLEELRSFLYDIAYYVLSGDVTLLDGETLGFSEEQKISITRSAGVAVEGDSLKLVY